jgi:ATP-dependent Lon protease
MLDEIDKLGQDFRGDPAAVLLEVLDPEQNREFVDHYLEIPFDLSRVMFIATANVVESLPGPLLDRLEVISFPGYTVREKQEIARRYLWPRQLRSHGLAHLKIDLTAEAVALVIQHYTQEAGLRQLNRTLATIARKLARLCLQDPAATQIPPVDRELVQRFLGPYKYHHEIAARQDRVGVATGLVWTAFGGQIIFVEAVRMKGHQQLLLTGSLGEVLRESAQTALSFVRSQAETLNLAPEFFAHSDIHIHIPAGAIPKDGPSAGVTIAVSLISLLTERPVRRDVALSGELTLNGQLLPVSGIREKLLAAQRAGVRMVILPRRNQADLEAVEPESREGMEVVLAENILDVLDLVLQPSSA